MQGKGQAIGKTEEEQWVDVLSNIGPVVALSNPTERYQSPGASRIMAADSEWQDIVEGYLKTARLTVLRLGDTEGLRWEIKRALETVEPKNLLLSYSEQEGIRVFSV